VCPSGSSIERAGACGDKLIFSAYLFPQGIYCVYDGTSHHLVGGIGSSDVQQFCDHTASCVETGSLPSALHCGATALTDECELQPVQRDAGSRDAVAVDAADATSAE
jgi:hypothetical protein